MAISNRPEDNPELIKGLVLSQPQQEKGTPAIHTHVMKNGHCIKCEPQQDAPIPEDLREMYICCSTADPKGPWIQIQACKDISRLIERIGLAESRLMQARGHIEKALAANWWEERHRLLRAALAATQEVKG